MPDSLPVYVATGKRKTAGARVRLKAGHGQILVNGKPVADYFSRDSDKILLRKPLEAGGIHPIQAQLQQIRMWGGGIDAPADRLRT